MNVAHRYEPRPTRRLDLRDLNGWRIRVHTITLPGEQFDLARFEPGLAMAAQALPPEGAQEGRAGVGFAIFHQGRGVDYVVLCWWARENELPIRVFVRDRIPAARWRAAQGEESICVWDLEVISRERDAYVRTVLAEPGPANLAAWEQAL
jgi:hypothetical protein